MASHNQHSADILPFPADHVAPRYVRPIPEEHIARALGEPVDCFQAFRDSDLERGVRKRDYRIAVALALLSWVAVIYFIAGVARGSTH